MLGMLCIKLYHWSTFDTHWCFFIAKTWHYRFHSHKGWCCTGQQSFPAF